MRAPAEEEQETVLEKETPLELLDPHLTKEPPNPHEEAEPETTQKKTGVNSNKILGKRVLGFGKSRAKRKPERFRPRPNPTNQRKIF
jgi:hypothetical protein